MLGNPASTIVRSFLSSIPALASIARTAMSTALPAALVAMTLPLRSATVLMSLSFGTMKLLV
jgi:hypothetical protein